MAKELAIVSSPYGLGRLTYESHGNISHFCAGMLLTLTLLKGLPTQHASAAYGSYMMVSIATGLLNSWPAPACTNPIFSGRAPYHHGLLWTYTSAADTLSQPRTFMMFQGQGMS